LPSIFDVSSELFEAKGAIWSEEKVHAFVVLSILNADKHDPGLVDAL
jgi:hypothetical protein